MGNRLLWAAGILLVLGIMIALRKPSWKSSAPVAARLAQDPALVQVLEASKGGGPSGVEGAPPPPESPFAKAHPELVGKLTKEQNDQAEVAYQLTGHDPREALLEQQNKLEPPGGSERAITLARAAEIRGNVEAALADPASQESNVPVEDLAARVDRIALSEREQKVVDALGGGPEADSLRRVFVSSLRDGGSAQTNDLLRQAYGTLASSPNSMTVISKAMTALSGGQFPETREALAQLALSIPGRRQEAEQILRSNGIPVSR
jgi:hypothetical protein